jgi:glucoamylase
MVMTALGTSRVWVTLGYGILNEVYWPATGQPQIRDLGFIVAGPSGWFEVKRVNRYQISMPEDCVPLPQVTHQGDRYRLVIEVVPDRQRAARQDQENMNGVHFARYCTPNSFIQQGSDLTPSDLRWVRSAKNHDPGCIS